jgi:hypothetical protein
LIFRKKDASGRPHPHVDLKFTNAVEGGPQDHLPDPWRGLRHRGGGTPVDVPGSFRKGGDNSAKKGRPAYSPTW